MIFFFVFFKGVLSRWITFTTGAFTFLESMAMYMTSNMLPVAP